MNEIKEELDQGAEIREELNGVHWKEYSDLIQVFSTIFQEETRALKLISDLNYYQGGYPSETTPPKIHSVFERVGLAARYFDLIGRLDEINVILGAYGMKIEPTGTSPVSMDTKRLDESKRATKAFTRLHAAKGMNIPTEPKEAVEYFLGKTFELQGVICQKADEIKITLFEQAKTKLTEIDKAGFVGAVNTLAAKRVKARKNKDTDALVEKALEKSETLVANGELLREIVVAKDE